MLEVSFPTRPPPQLQRRSYRRNHLGKIWYPSRTRGFLLALVTKSLCLANERLDIHAITISNNCTSGCAPRERRTTGNKTLRVQGIPHRLR
jgi:hypothetical protein